MFCNESISKFLSSMGKDDLLVLFSDTPPMFSGKRRIMERIFQEIEAIENNGCVFAELFFFKYGFDHGKL